MSYEHIKDVRRNGLIAIKLNDKDSLLGALLIEKGDTIILASKKGQAIRFKESDIREMGRVAGGVRAMKISKGDEIIGSDVVKKENEKDSYFFTMSENGLGKKTEVKEYKLQKRGGSGIKTTKITTKTGDLIVAKVVNKEEELIAISKKSQVIKTPLDSIPNLGRQTQGVTIMKLRSGDNLASVVCL